MSKKNLARTALEGGRGNGNKWERRNSHTEERAAARDFCNKVKIDPEYALEDIIEDKPKVYKGFSDKLNPVYRWLESKVGQRWNDVRSEISEKFDARTTAGRHILFDHLLSSVVDTESGFNQYGFIVDPDEAKIAETDIYRRIYQDYYVDKDGILCEIKNNRLRYEHISEKEYREAGEWLAGRMIMEKGGVFYWCFPNDGLWKSSWHEPGQPFNQYNHSLGYYLFDNGLHDIPGMIGWAKTPTFTGKVHSDYWKLIENPFSFKQRGQLSIEELKEFKSLKKRLQKEILEFTKGR